MSLSFKTLYIRSERLQPPGPLDDLFWEAALFLGNGHGIPLHILELKPPYMFASAIHLKSDRLRQRLLEKVCFTRIASLSKMSIACFLVL